jgi:hypothetical protein
MIEPGAQAPGDLLADPMCGIGTTVIEATDGDEDLARSPRRLGGKAGSPDDSGAGPARGTRHTTVDAYRKSC